MDTLHTAKNEINQDTHDKLMTIGSSVALTHPFIYEKISLLHHVHNRNINLLIMDHSIIPQSLVDGKLDLAFVTEPIIHKQLDCYHVYSERIGLIVSRRHPLAGKSCLDNLSDLEKDDLIFYKPFYKDQTFDQTIKCRKRIMTNQLELVHDLILHHDGVSFLPENTFQTEIRNGAFVHIPIHHNVLDRVVQYFLVSRKSELFYVDIFMGNGNSLHTSI